MTKNTANVKLDSEGKPFKFKAVQLPKKEYAEVMSEIGRWWHTKYDGVEFCRMDFTDKTYFFENRGIGDYNIYNVRRNKK